MVANAGATQSKLKKFIVTQIVMICVLLVFFLFGVSCLISKSLFEQKNVAQTIFNKTVLQCVDNRYEPQFKQGTNIVINKQNEFNIGDYVIFINSQLADFKIVQIVNIYKEQDATKYEINEINSSVNQIVEGNLLFGKVVSTSAFYSAWINFLLSNFIVWVFVVLPGIALIVICIIAICFRIKRDKQKCYDKLNDEIIAEALKCIEQEKDACNQSSDITKNSQLDTYPIKKLEPIVFNNSKTQKQKRKKETINKKENHKENIKTGNKNSNRQVREPLILQEIKKVQSKTSSPKVQSNEYKLNYHKKSANDKRDNYVFEKLPTIDTNQPIRRMLNKNTNIQDEKTNSQKLLQKMRDKSNK